jgi:hypothetical protein
MRKISYQKPIPIDASPPEAGVAISKRDCFVASLLAMTRGSVIARLPVREAVAIS